MMSSEVNCIWIAGIALLTLSIVDCGEIYLDNDGLCDTKDVYPNPEVKCKRVIVHGEGFSDSSSVTCRLHLVHYEEDCADNNEGCSTHKITKGNHFKDLRGNFINSTTVLCELYRLKGYFISVGNDRENLPEPKLYLPYSSLCQVCSTKTATCFSTPDQRKKYCHNMHLCYEPAEEHPHYGCRTCRAMSDGAMAWLREETEECQDHSFPLWGTVIILLVGGAVLIASGVLVSIYCFKSRHSRLI